MSRLLQFRFIRPIQFLLWSKLAPTTTGVLALLLVMPAAAIAQASPFDTGFNAIQSLFTGTIAKVASLVAIVIGGYSFAHGEPGAKKALAGVAAGTGIAVLSVNVLSWLWGV
jgi:type IV secretion system protein VirB2